MRNRTRTAPEGAQAAGEALRRRGHTPYGSPAAAPWREGPPKTRDRTATPCERKERMIISEIVQRRDTALGRIFDSTVIVLILVSVITVGNIAGAVAGGAASGGA